MLLGSSVSLVFLSSWSYPVNKEEKQWACGKSMTQKLWPWLKACVEPTVAKVLHAASFCKPQGLYRWQCYAVHCFAVAGAETQKSPVFSVMQWLVGGCSATWPAIEPTMAYFQATSLASALTWLRSKDLWNTVNSSPKCKSKTFCDNLLCKRDKGQGAKDKARLGDSSDLPSKTKGWGGGGDGGA